MHDLDRTLDASEYEMGEFEEEFEDEYEYEDEFEDEYEEEFTRNPCGRPAGRDPCNSSAVYNRPPCRRSDSPADD